MRGVAPLAVAGLCLLATGAAAQTAGRYTAPGGVFSIAMAAPPDRAFTIEKEQSDAAHVFVVFKFAPGTPAHGASGERSIVWSATTDLVPDPDTAATGLVNAYLSDRFPQGGFSVDVRLSARTASGRLYRIFQAHGRYRDLPSAWQGFVLFFPGKGIALIGEVHTLNGEGLRATLGLGDAETAAWATSFEPAP